MWHRSELAASVVIASVGGVVGAAFVWLNRPDPASCTTLENGVRACMPIHVVDPPLWIYGAFAIGGAFLAGGMALLYVVFRRPRGQ